MKLIIITSVALSLLFSSGPEGKTFPSLSGENLEGKTLSLPTCAKGKKTLIGMAYSQKAEEALMTWYQPVFDKFVNKLGMFDSQYDVNLYFIPMYVGLKQAAYESTLKELRKSSRKDLYPYIIFYKGELSPYDTELGLKDKEQPYFFVLDENGKVLHHLTGPFTEKKMEEIEGHLE
jgi:ATP10 protein